VIILTYGDIMDGGKSVFTSVAKLDQSKLIITFTGVIRIDNPYKYLEHYLNELEKILPQHKIHTSYIDFTELKFCNSNGFYVIMDIVDLIYKNVESSIFIKRLKDDDWQQETLPILLDIDNPDINQRTFFDDVWEA
jgi:hypothetical protein